MAMEKKRGNRETKKQKKPVPKTIAAAASTKNSVSEAFKSGNRK